MKLRCLSAALALAFAAPAPAAPDFGQAGTYMHGKAQRDFYDKVLANKRANARDHAKSLVLSHEMFGIERPPLDLGPLAHHWKFAGDAWLRFAAHLYAGGEYTSAAAAIERVDFAYRDENPSAMYRLQSRLALRGHGRMPRPETLVDKALEDEFNLALVDLRAKNTAAALAKLGQIEAAGGGEHRDRALIWSALVLAEAGKRTEALAALGRIDGASPLVVDALLAWLRIEPSADPVQVAAIGRYLAATAGASPIVWEVRDRLLQALRSRGATADLVVQAVDATAVLARAVEALRRDMRRADAMSPAEIAQRKHLMTDQRRHRVEALLRQRESLAQIAAQLGEWQGHLAGYRDRLRSDSARFSDEIAIEVFASQARRAAEGSGQGALFHLELAKLVGIPAEAETAYRLFFGLAQTELSYEYPENWRPSSEPPKEAGAERRRMRQQLAKQERDDKKYYPIAVEHARKLYERVGQRLQKLPKRVFQGMAEESAALIASAAKRRAEILAALPEVDEAVRQEFVGQMREDVRTAQLWLLRFAALAVVDNAQLGSGREQPQFAFDRTLAPRPGVSLLAAVQAIAAPAGRRPAVEVPLVGLLDALKPLTVEGETRALRADALRLRAQLVVQLSEAQAIPSAADAAEHYATLLGDYADLIDRPEITYQLARAYDLSQRPERSLALLEEFVRKFPKDSRVAEAGFRIADAQFELGEYPRARSGYEAVIRTGDRRYLDQAEYKLAWTLFKLGEFKPALARFVAVIDRGYGGKAGDDAARRNRMLDAFRAVSLTLANLDGAAEAERFFSGKGKRPYVGDIYASLAAYYLDHQRVNDAAEAYGYLHKHYPNHERAPDLLAATATAARQEKLHKLSLDLQEMFVDRYAMNGPYWNQAGDDVRQRIRGHLQPFVGELAQLYHADAQKQSKRESYLRAIRMYSQFVLLFPENPKTPQYHFQLAEARYETGDLAGAVVDYEKAAYDYGRHPRSGEAGYALLVATQKQIAESSSDADARKAAVRALVARSGRFAATFPEDGRVEAVLAKAGEDSLTVGDPGEAVRLGQMLLARKPAEALVRRSQLFMAHGYFESGAYLQAEAAYLVVLGHKGRSAAEQKELRERLGLSVYRQGEVAREAGKTALAIDTFLRVAKAAPGTEAIPNAEIDASVLLVSSRRWDEAIAILERFEKTYPGHRLGAEVPVRLAFAYEAAGRYLPAADMLEKLSQGEKDDALARQMLWRAAELREKGERMDLAIATYERYLVRYPLPLEKATEVRQSLADLAAKAKDRPRRDRWLNEIIARARAASEADATLRVRFLAAQASVTLGDAAVEEFGRIQLRLPLDKSLAAKRAPMETALRLYTDAGRFGIAEVTTAATYKIAEIYRQLARDVMASDRPSGLNALETSQYDVLLEEQATPFEEKATEFHELNYQRIADGVYDDWVKRSLVALRTLQPGQYDKVELAVGLFEYVPPPPPKPAAPAGLVPANSGGSNATPAR